MQKAKKAVTGGTGADGELHWSETGGTRFQRARFQTPSSVSFLSTALLLNEVSEKSRETWYEVSEIFSEICSESCPEIHPDISCAFLAGRKVLPQNFTRFFPSEISNFKSTSKSNFTKHFTTHFCRLGSPKVFLALTEFRGESSVSSSRPFICVPKRTHRVFSAELTEFATGLSEFSLPKQYSWNSIPCLSLPCSAPPWYSCHSAYLTYVLYLMTLIAKRVLSHAGNPLLLRVPHPCSQRTDSTWSFYELCGMKQYSARFLIGPQPNLRSPVWVGQTLRVFSMGVLLPHVGPGWTLQHSELLGNP